MKKSSFSSGPGEVGQHHQCTSPFLGRQNCANEPNTSGPQLATPPSSVTEEPASDSTSGSRSIMSFLSESSFAGLSAAARGSVGPREEHPSTIICASQNGAKRPEPTNGLKNGRRLKELLRRSSTLLQPLERLSESSTTAAAGLQTEGDWQAEEAVPLGQPAKRLPSGSARRQEGAHTETAEERAAVLEATNHLLRQALQRSKEEIATLELLQTLHQEAHHLEDSLTPRESAASPSLSTQSLEGREEASGEPIEERQAVNLLNEGNGARRDDPLQTEQKQLSRERVRGAEQQGHQKADQMTQDPESHIFAQLLLDCIYPFRDLRAITGDPCTASDRDTSPISKCIQEELRRSQLALEQQQQEAQRMKGEIRALKARLAATSLQSKKQQSQLERKLNEAKANAGTASAEAAAAKAREENLALQLEKLQQQMAAFERSAAATSSRLSAHLRAANAREEKLEKSLAEARESLAFVESLQRKPHGLEESSSFGSTGRSGKESFSLDRRSLRSLTTCSFRSSSSPGETTSPQHQGGKCERKSVQGLPTSSSKSAVCLKSLQAQQLSDNLDGSKNFPAPPSAASDAQSRAGIITAKVGKQDAQAATAFVSPESSPGNFMSIASSFHRGKTLGASSKPDDASGDYCRSALCGQVRWTLQQRLCSANASLIVKTQLLAAEQAKAQELQLLIEDQAAAAKAAEAAADGAFKKLLSVMSRNASLQAKLALASAAASATQRQRRNVAKPYAMIENLREAQKRLQFQCTLLSKEKDVWKERLEQQLHIQHQLMEELQQQQLLLVDAHADRAGKTHRRDRTRQSSRCSRAAKEGAPSATANALSNADDLPPRSEADPLLSTLQQLVKGLQQWEKNVTFVPPSCGAADDPLCLLSTSSGCSTEQQHWSKQLNGQQSALVVCQWPPDRRGQTENIGEARDRNNDPSFRLSAKGLARGLMEAGNSLMTQLCATVLELGSRLKDCKDEATKSRRESSMLRDLLRNERVTRCRVQFENGFLEAQLSALQTKLTVMESFAEAEAQKAAESHKAQVAEISRQLQSALETLKGWERERPLLVSQQLVLAQRVTRLETALRAALVRYRQEVEAAKKAAEDSVFQTLSGWRESLVKTTVEAAESCCDCKCSSSGSRCDIGTASDGPWSATRTPGHARDSDQTAYEEAEAEGEDRAPRNCGSTYADPVVAKCPHHLLPLVLSEAEMLKAMWPFFLEVVEELADLPCSPRERQADLPWPQRTPEECRRPLRGSSSMRRDARAGAASSRRVLEQHQHQQQLFAAYSAQQEELQSTSGALGKAHAEIGRLRDCLKALETQAHALGEAAAIGEAAAAQSATLQAQLYHVKVGQQRSAFDF
ncbi:hypothetical protein Emag_003952 [Eimeria magna]